MGHDDSHSPGIGLRVPVGCPWLRSSTVTAHSLDAAGLRALMRTFRDALVAHRTTLNLLNVYPVPDGDTGSNMTMTVDSVCVDLEALDQTADMDAFGRGHCPRVADGCGG
ncbi:MAG: hypothetical protein CM1200mP26_08430 [Acidimicrobiales bacterium]|nr:MAG: hypothetical protein CM1200mP26_08430 [Acidimicrobiales bacterium]